MLVVTYLHLPDGPRTPVMSRWLPVQRVLTQLCTIGHSSHTAASKNSHFSGWLYGYLWCFAVIKPRCDAALLHSLTADCKPRLAHTFLDLHAFAWAVLCLFPSNKAALNAIRLCCLEKVAWSSKTEIWQELCGKTANQLLKTVQILWDCCWWIVDLLMLFRSVYFRSKTSDCCWLVWIFRALTSIFIFAKLSVWTRQFVLETVQG